MMMLTENRDKRTRKQQEKIKQKLSQKKLQKKRDQRRSNARDAKYQQTSIYGVESTRTSQSLREELVGLGLPRTGNRQALIERLSQYNNNNNNNNDNNYISETPSRSCLNLMEPSRNLEQSRGTLSTLAEPSRNLEYPRGTFAEP